MYVLWAHAPTYRFLIYGCNRLYTQVRALQHGCNRQYIEVRALQHGCNRLYIEVRTLWTGLQFHILLFRFLYVCVCRCVCICVCICVWARVRMCVCVCVSEKGKKRWWAHARARAKENKKESARARESERVKKKARARVRELGACVTNLGKQACVCSLQISQITPPPSPNKWKYASPHIFTQDHMFSDLQTQTEHWKIECLYSARIHRTVWHCKKAQ